MIYKKLHRTWSHNSANYIPRFTEVFPELSKIDSEELHNRFIKLKIDFFYEEKTPVNMCVRLTLPFAFITMLLMFIGLPILFLITGKWNYSLGDENRLLNWFRSLHLL